MITCKEELYGTCFVIERREDAALLEAKCIELGIEKARWYGCNYDGGISIGMISKDLETAYSKKLVFSARSQSSETMTEFCDLKRLVLEDLEPQAKEVDWVSGDECRYNGINWLFCGFHPTNGLAIVANNDEPSSHQVITVDVALLSKPETPEQKLERERVEAAKYLYSKHCVAVKHPFKDLDNNSELLNAWLVIVDETNYKVKGE